MEKNRNSPIKERYGKANVEVTVVLLSIPTKSTKPIRSVSPVVKFRIPNADTASASTVLLVN